MKKSTKFGLTLAGIHTLLVFAFLVAGFSGVSKLSQHLLEMTYALDAPVFLTFSYLFQLLDLRIWYEHILFPVLIGVVGGAWWFFIGWILFVTHDRLRSSGRGTRLFVTCALIFAIILYAMSVQLFVTLDYILWDGCAHAGIPLEFLWDCGNLRLDISFSNLAVNFFVWIAAGLVVSLIVDLASQVRKNASLPLRN